MPPHLFLLLIATVLLAGGLTVALISASGWPLALLAPAAVLASLAVRSR